MSVFDLLKEKTAVWRDQDHLRMLVDFANGSISGTLAAALTHPTDLVRKKIQVQDLKNPTYKGFFHCFYIMFTTEGPKSLFRGLVPNVMKCAPTFAIAFMVNEKLKDMLGVKRKI
mmetsp:Transcript_58990/g.128071  ORF Transcript_58990/g.128071 Transcript_58990/m.128071 type:complete len:115 (+) Transcript_58990:505-849(+)